MINSQFYNSFDLVHQYLGGKISHYPVKDKSIVKSTYDYILKDNENLYTLAAKIFGDNLQYMWTYIADCNPPRHPDDWNTGDIVKLPLVVIRDSETNEFFNKLKRWE